MVFTEQFIVQRLYMGLYFPGIGNQKPARNEISLQVYRAGEFDL
jgi:hypothetical protein